MSRFSRWSRAADIPVDYQALKARLDFLADRLFVDYEPTRSAGPQFSDRLIDWLDSAGDEEDQQLMFELLGHLYFVGVMEMELLYQDVFHGPITWWLIDTFQIGISEPDLEIALDSAMERTWFCPVTDSMQIARFHHINNIAGKDLRPDWHTLSRLGDPNRIAAYAEKEGLECLVLLEDFVGTGTQAARALRFACQALPDMPILFAPLLVCPAGVVRITKLLEEIGGERVRFDPIVTLPSECILSPDAQPGEPERFEALRSMLERVRPLVGATSDNNCDAVYGFGSTGALSVMYTNCPNNVPPAIHRASPQWRALFPRSIRK